mgnify:CR=1 FL=1
MVDGEKVFQIFAYGIEFFIKGLLHIMPILQAFLRCYLLEHSIDSAFLLIEPCTIFKHSLQSVLHLSWQYLYPFESLAEMVDASIDV